jgi:hypothetical protein
MAANIGLKMGYVDEKGELNPGFKKRNWFNRRYKRYKRKFNRTKCGRKLKNIRQEVRQTWVGKNILGWYEGLFSGSITMLISILNMLTIPYLHFYEAVEDHQGVKAVLGIQLFANYIYALDFFLMICIFGMKSILFKRSWALRLELPVQIYYVLMWPLFIKIFSDLPTTKDESQSLFSFLQLLILMRLLRIFSFLNELEQWRFFSKAVKIMRGPFFNLAFTLYSLFYLYTIIGIEIFGGAIDSELFIFILENFPDSDIAGDYIWLNFNDYASGLITLESMMLFNNWQFIWD